MPNYDYTCHECKHSLEVFQKITEEPLKLCPECNKEALHRGIGGGGATLRFKGSGFYLTDYAKPQSVPKSCPCDSSSSC